MAFDEFVFGAHKGLGTAGVALAGGASEELAIDAAGFVALGGDHVETTVCCTMAASSGEPTAPRPN